MFLDVFQQGPCLCTQNQALRGTRPGAPADETGDILRCVVGPGAGRHDLAAACLAGDPHLLAPVAMMTGFVARDAEVDEVLRSAQRHGPQLALEQLVDRLLASLSHVITNSGFGLCP